MKALVVGGTGFVGMNVVRTLIRNGHEVRATRRARGNTLFARKLGVKLVQAELDDADSLEAAMQNTEVVFHCAGFYPRYSLNPEEQVRAARASTSKIIDAARRAGVQRLVLTSSIATVGPPKQPNRLSNESDPMSPLARESVYFSVKQAIEEEALAARDLDTLVVCPGGILGELDVKAGTGFMIVALAHGLLPFYIQGKTNIVDADDMAIGHLAAAEFGKTGQRYILGGHNVTLKQLLTSICEELNVRFFSWPMPLAIARPLSSFDEARCAIRNKGERPFIPREFVDMMTHGHWVDTSKATQELGLPSPTPLYVTIQKACAWYERFRYIPRRSHGNERLFNSSPRTPTSPLQDSKISQSSTTVDRNRSPVA